MAKITQFSSKQTIQEHASLWISRMDRGLTADEQKTLSIWLNESDAHKDALFNLAKLWDDLSVLNELSDLFPLETKTKQKRFVPIAMAASFAAIMLTSASLMFTDISLPFINTSHQIAQIKDYQTKIGEQVSFSLSDGTSIRLNTNSQIQVTFTQSHRQISLLKGEARFDVAKDKNRPFTVSVEDKSFTALGTIFNVQKNDINNLELVVTEGKVLISDTNTINQRLDNIVASFKTLEHNKLAGSVVNSGEKSVVSHNTQISKISLDQIQKELSWQQGMLIFDATPLNTALNEVSRYNDIQFEFTDKSLSDLKISGYFKSGDIDTLLQSLSDNLDIQFKKTSNKTIQLTAIKV
jgi:transmembrane sensor